MTAVISAQQLLDAMLDTGSFVSWDKHLNPSAHSASVDPIASAVATDEAVITGEGRVRGHRIAFAVSDFAFLGGSVGVAAAQRMVACVARATEEQLPLFTSPSSGGIRMQEGTLAFAYLVPITAAITRHRAAALAHLVYLRHPSMGGVIASWGSLGQVTAAQPGAQIALVGPRVRSALGRPPQQRVAAESLFQSGLIDAVLPPRELPGFIAKVLSVIGPARGAGSVAPPVHPEVLPRGDAWDSVRRSRRPRRPGARELLSMATDVTSLWGAQHSTHHPGLIIVLGRIRTVPCLMIAQDRIAQTTEGGLISPASLRAARRAMSLAEELRLPLLTVIDTPGASVTYESDQEGLAWEIANCMADLITLRTPTVSLLLGQGSGAAALALLPADEILCAQHSWLAPLAPEGASAVLFRDTAHAAIMAAEQGIRPADLLSMGLVDSIIPEDPDAAEEPEQFLDRVSQRIGRALAVPSSTSFMARQNRYHRLTSPPVSP